MPSYAGPPTPPRSGEIADSLRLMIYLGLAVALIVLDHRGGWLHQTRTVASQVVQPLWAVAGWPGQAMRRVQDDAGTLGQLTEENQHLRQELLLSQARMARLRTVAADNERLRGLLGAAQTSGVDVQLAPILDIDLDPTRQRIVVRAGTADGVRVGQSVIDAGGLLGQVIATNAQQSTVLLITDPAHAVPVAVVRNGVRLVAYGSGEVGGLRLGNIPISSDVKAGDELITSGLGGRFPAGFMVGTIVELSPDESRAYLQGVVRPAAQLDRGRDVLLLRAAPPTPSTTGTPPAGAAGSGEQAPGTSLTPGAPPAASAVPSPGMDAGAIAPANAAAVLPGQQATVSPALQVRYPRRPASSTGAGPATLDPAVSSTGTPGTGGPASTATEPTAPATAIPTQSTLPLSTPPGAAPVRRPPSPPASPTATDEGAGR